MTQPGTSTVRTAQQALGDFASGLTATEIPGVVMEHAKLDILDTLGCALFGSTLPVGEILVDGFAALSHSGPAGVWGRPWAAHPDTAVLINGTLAHSFELDDLHPVGILHPGGTTLPALLATIPGRDASGAEVLAAHVAGLESACRVGLACGLGLLRRGWHSNGILGVFGSAAGFASILQLSAQQAGQAIGIAGSLASGLMAAQFGSMVKRMHAGQAAQTGLRVATLAARGFTGTDSLFETEYGGFLHTYSDTSDPGELTSELGLRWETLQVGFKLNPACGSSHTSVDAIRELRSRSPFAADDVEAVTVRCSTATNEHVGWPYVPDSVTTAQMNLPYAVATAILKGTVTIDDYSPDAIRSDRVIDLAQRSATVAELAIDAGGRERRHEVWVTVALTSGETLTTRQAHAFGSPSNPAPVKDIIAKFMMLAGRALSEDRCSAIRDLVLELERHPSITPLLELLSTA
jgi:aconitate decarboxylase